MGLGGFKPKFATRDKEIWRVYLVQLSLGYLSTTGCWQETAKRTGQTLDVVRNTIYMTKPIGVYHE